MTRLQKKCFVASSGAHALLAATLIAAAAIPFGAGGVGGAGDTLDFAANPRSRRSRAANIQR